MRRRRFGAGRLALHNGRHKINLRPHPTPIDLVVAHLEACAVSIISRPVARTGAEGPILSVYRRDPDRNIIEIANSDA